jgi:hypothetical protein
LPSTYAPCPSRGHPSVEDKDALDDEDAVEDDDAGGWVLRTAAITATTTTRPAARILRTRIRRVADRADWPLVTPPVKAAWCCLHVCDFRYAGDMRRL